MPYLGTFDQKYFISVILGKDFQKAIVMFEINTLKLFFLQNFKEKQKRLNLWPKTPDLGILGWDLKATLSYLKSTPTHLSNSKISRKNKNAWIWDQKCSIWVFLVKNALLGIFGRPQICLIAKFCKQKQKYLNLGPEMPYLGIFLTRTLINYCHIWN